MRDYRIWRTNTNFIELSPTSVVDSFIQPSGKFVLSIVPDSGSSAHDILRSGEAEVNNGSGVACAYNTCIIISSIIKTQVDIANHKCMGHLYYGVYTMTILHTCTYLRLIM